MKKFFFLLLICFSCNLKETGDKSYVARVGDNYLDYSELKNQIPSNISLSDSLSLANKIILEWATSQLLIQSAQINLNKDEKELIDQKSKKYRDNLILSDYRNKISKKNPDTIVSKYEIEDFFDKNSKNFKLYNEIVQGRYLKLNNTNFNINEIKRRFSRFNTIDKSFFDSISIQLLNYSFNDSTWIDKTLFFNKISSINENEVQRIVKNNLFYIKEDSLALYLIKINKYKKANDYAPLDYIYGRIRELIANRKRIDYLMKIEIELIDDAITKNIYEKID
ncbi:MAG: hypothetical protein CMD13_00905 [Flavobacteriales bacterium]|nr:hypothetical protein [Flavobacteriales bacterium]